MNPKPRNMNTATLRPNTNWLKPVIKGKTILRRCEDKISHNSKTKKPEKAFGIIAIYDLL